MLRIILYHVLLSVKKLLNESESLGHVLRNVVVYSRAQLLFVLLPARVD